MCVRYPLWNLHINIPRPGDRPRARLQTQDAGIQLKPKFSGATLSCKRCRWCLELFWSLRNINLSSRAWWLFRVCGALAMWGLVLSSCSYILPTLRASVHPFSLFSHWLSNTENNSSRCIFTRVLSSRIDMMRVRCLSAQTILSLKSQVEVA